MITVRYLSERTYAMDEALYCGIRIGGDDQVGLVKSAVALGFYDAVCELETDDMEEAFEIMQNGVRTDSWLLDPVPGTRPLVQPHVMGGQKYGWRSACVGDIFSVNGVDYVCASFGFTQLHEED